MQAGWFHKRHPPVGARPGTLVIEPAASDARPHRDREHLHPPEFLAGVYGMNFEGMPELHTRVGYPAVLIAMVVIAAGLIRKFRSLGWIGGTGDGGRGTGESVS